MRFFEKLLSSLSKSNEENNYARATLDYATSPEIKKSNAIVFNNRRLAFETVGNYGRAVKDYTKALEITTDNAKAVTNFEVAGLEGSKVRITFYKSRSSKNYRSIIQS